jgi:DNA polymerase III delta subunit
MITLLVGENSFEIEQTLRRYVADFSGTPERLDGAELEVRQLPDILMGLSLFAEKRLVIIRGLGGNKAIWDALPDWLDRMNDDIHLVLVEPKPDKRTKSWKALQKVATVHEFKIWTDRDARTAQQWASEQATFYGTSLAADSARLLIERVGVDQWQLAQTLQRLSVFDEITEAIIREQVDARPHENVFELFETALNGRGDRLQEMVRVLRRSEEPYQLFGLLSGQAFQLAALAVAREGDDVAKDLGVHPFVVADEAMKTSSIDPWIMIERSLAVIVGRVAR